MHKHILQELLEDAGYECRSYSGRGMYGKSCLGVQANLADLFADVLETTIYAIDSDAGALGGMTPVVDAFRQMKTDSMGKGQIVYFEGVEYTDEDPNTDDAPESEE